MKNVQDDVALSGNWLQSTHFPNLATSFNHLLQSSTNPLASMDLSSLPLVRIAGLHLGTIMKREAECECVSEGKAGGKEWN